MEQALRSLDTRLVQATQGVKLLSHVSWPASIRDAFLAGWRDDSPRLPVVEYKPVSLDETRVELDRISHEATGIGSAIGDFLSETARSYARIAELMVHAGSERAGELSSEIYGRPGMLIPGSDQTSVDAARYFIDVSRDFRLHHQVPESAYCIPASIVASEITTRIRAVIDEDVITVVIDPNLTAKAAAGATRIRIREGTSFSESDINQLLQHEAFVHSLTALNGRRQPNLKSLSLGAPRTTAAQEGLATFAELVTGAIDISRMARLAMRVLAIEMALSGADFIEVFRFFLESGQNEVESYNSAARVFRGVPVTGGTAFTKDVVYLTGLLEVHTFFRWALTRQKLNLCEHLFAGRMKLSDVLKLEAEFENGTLAAPRYLPPWLVQTNGLTAYLAFSVFADAIKVADVGSDAFNI